MKQFKVLVALVLAMMMTLALCSSAMAATITINRNTAGNWNPSAESAKATFTPHKVFDAIITTAGTTTNGVYTPGVVVYTVDTQAKADAVNALTTLKAEAASDGKWYISKEGTPSDADILADIKTLVTGNPSLFPAGTPVTSDTNPVVINVSDVGYYYIEASNGKNVAVQTIDDVTITEKNDYPTIDKKQKQESGEEYKDEAEPAEIGSYIDYQLIVHIPADATKQIAVIDKMSAGLAYDDTTGLTLSPNVTYTDLTSADDGYDANAAWQIKFAPDVVEANRGQNITITYRAKVTSAALTDTGKENEVKLYYDNSNYILKDDVDYEIYYTGIEKVELGNDSVKLDGVEFTLKAGNDEIKVSKPDGKDYYIPDANGSSTVVTANGGIIKIRGLDNDKTYTLTETKTKAGYNLLKDPKTLTLVKDEGADIPTNATFDKVENGKGAELPSTGGIGTTIFYVAGLILVLGAATILVARRKAESDAE